MELESPTSLVVRTLRAIVFATRRVFIENILCFVRVVVKHSDWVCAERQVQ